MLGKERMMGLFVHGILVNWLWRIKVLVGMRKSKEGKTVLLLTMAAVKL